jgi:hypothetical protein
MPRRWSVNANKMELLTSVSEHLAAISPDWRASIAADIYRRRLVPFLRLLIALDEDPSAAGAFLLPSASPLPAAASGNSNNNNSSSSMLPSPAPHSQRTATIVSSATPPVASLYNGTTGPTSALFNPVAASTASTTASLGGISSENIVGGLHRGSTPPPPAGSNNGGGTFGEGLQSLSKSLFRGVSTEIASVFSAPPYPLGPHSKNQVCILCNAE